jgi:hypothetical protein
MTDITTHTEALARIVASGERIEQQFINYNPVTFMLEVSHTDLLTIVQGALILTALAVKDMPDEDLQAFRKRILDRVIATHNPKDGKHESIGQISKDEPQGVHGSIETGS